MRISQMTLGRTCCQMVLSLALTLLALLTSHSLAQQWRPATAYRGLRTEISEVSDLRLSCFDVMTTTSHLASRRARWEIYRRTLIFRRRNLKMDRAFSRWMSSLRRLTITAAAAGVGLRTAVAWSRAITVNNRFPPCLGVRQWGVLTAFSDRCTPHCPLLWTLPTMGLEWTTIWLISLKKWRVKIVNGDICQRHQRTFMRYLVAIYAFN